LGLPWLQDAQGLAKRRNGLFNKRTLFGCTFRKLQECHTQAGLRVHPLAYVDVAVRRWQTYSGKTAVLESTGQTFEQVEEQRIASVTTTMAPPPTPSDLEAA
jgi:hypothetical protein